MKISPIKTYFNKPNFKARNPEIRFADDISRKVNTVFPRISSTNVDCFQNIDKFTEMHKRIMENILNVRCLLYRFFVDSKNDVERALSFIQPVQEGGYGNCGEAVDIAVIVAKMNGIENCDVRSIETTTGKDLNHGVLYIDGKKPYVIDPWLGFADYVPNAIKKYKGEYKYRFNIQPEDKPIFISIIGYEQADFCRKKISDEDIQTLRKMFPELVLRDIPTSAEEDPSIIAKDKTEIDESM